jgi:hypothetical protein
MGYGDATRIQTRSGVLYSDLGLADEAALTSLIGDLNDQASDLIDSYCGRDFAQHTDVEETHDGTGRRTLRLDGYPVIGVTSVTIDGTATTDYTVRDAAGILSRTYQVWPVGQDNVVVVYSHGYASPPPAIVAVTEDMVVSALVHAAKNRTTKGANSLSMDGFSVSYSEVAGQMILTPEIVQALSRFRATGGA